MKTPCEECKIIAEKAIDGMPSDISCGVASGLIAAAIAAAGDGNPIADALAVVAAVVLNHYCEENGWPWIKSHSDVVAEAMCKEAKLCW